MEGPGTLIKVETKPAPWRRVIGPVAALALCALALFALHRELQTYHSQPRVRWA